MSVVHACLSATLTRVFRSLTPEMWLLVWIRQPVAPLRLGLVCSLLHHNQITVSVATDRAALATGLARGLEIGSCAFSGANTF